MHELPRSVKLQVLQVQGRHQFQEAADLNSSPEDRVRTNSLTKAESISSAELLGTIASRTQRRYPQINCLVQLLYERRGYIVSRIARFSYKIRFMISIIINIIITK
jgi:hypothetical protein